MPSENVRNLLARIEASNRSMARQTRYLRTVNMFAIPALVFVLLWMEWSQAPYGFTVLLVAILVVGAAAAPGLWTTKEQRDGARAMKAMSELDPEELR